MERLILSYRVILSLMSHLTSSVVLSSQLLYAYSMTQYDVCNIMMRYLESLSAIDQECIASLH